MIGWLTGLEDFLLLLLLGSTYCHILQHLLAVVTEALPLAWELLLQQLMNTSVLE